MVAITQVSRTPTATAQSPYISSFLPKCTNLLQLQLPLRSFTRLSSRCVAASTKQKKKSRSSSSAREWSYEHLMVVWDEVFEQCCTDSVKAAKIRDLSYNGLPKHGRGCVLVFQEVQTRPRGSGTGFTSKPPKSSRRVPDFVVLDWYAVYLPRDFLLDPRKAPNEAEMAPQGGDSDMPETCKEFKDNAVVQTVNFPRDTTKDVTIDVEDIIRQAQDVYTFGSDDDDDDEDELDVHADDGDFNNENLLSWDNREEASATNRMNLEDLNEKENDIVIPVSEPNNPYDAPLLFFDEDEPVLTTSPEAEMESTKDISQVDAHVNFTNISAQTNFVAEDGTLEIADGILVETPDVHRDHVIDYTYSRRGKANMSIRTAAGANPSLSASILDGEACNGAHKATVLNETGGHTVEVLQESNEVNAPSMNGLSAKENTFTVDEGMEDQGGENDDVELATQQILLTSMRGVDMTRLLSLTANFDFEAERFRSGRRMAMIDTKTMDAGGEDPYNPKEDELVMLLHLVIDGRPAYGADVVIAYRDETQTVGLEKEPWKLKAKYKV